MAPATVSPPLDTVRAQPVLPPEPSGELAGIQFVDVEETVLRANKCSCSASDDNPY